MPGKRGLEFKIAPGRRVQDDRVAVALDGNGRKVRQRGFLRIRYVLQQGARRTNPLRTVFAVEACEVGNAELCAQQAVRAVEIEVPGRAAR